MFSSWYSTYALSICMQYLQYVWGHWLYSTQHCRCTVTEVELHYHNFALSSVYIRNVTVLCIHIYATSLSSAYIFTQRHCPLHTYLRNVTVLCIHIYATSLSSAYIFTQHHCPLHTYLRNITVLCIHIYATSLSYVTSQTIILNTTYTLEPSGVTAIQCMRNTYIQHLVTQLNNCFLTAHAKVL